MLQYLLFYSFLFTAEWEFPRHDGMLMPTLDHLRRSLRRSVAKSRSRLR